MDIGPPAKIKPLINLQCALTSFGPTFFQSVLSYPFKTHIDTKTKFQQWSYAVVMWGGAPPLKCRL